MGITALSSKYDPQLAGAIGAAIVAAEPAKTAGKWAIKSGV